MLLEGSSKINKDEEFFLFFFFTELGKVERVSVLTYVEFCIGYVSLEV